MTGVSSNMFDAPYCRNFPCPVENAKRLLSEGREYNNGCLISHPSPERKSRRTNDDEPGLRIGGLE
jgi:hypothetical protein